MLHVPKFGWRSPYIMYNCETAGKVGCTVLASGCVNEGVGCCQCSDKDTSVHV